MKLWKILMLAGIALFFVEQVYPLVTLQILAIPSTPDDGAIYSSLVQAQIIINKPFSSGIDYYDELYFTIDKTMPAIGEFANYVFSASEKMTKVEDTATYLRFQISITSPSTGSHSFAFGAGYRIMLNPPGMNDWNDPAQVEVIKKGGFTIDPTYNVLSGDWYILSVKIVSSTQVVQLRTNNIKFRFVKTSSYPDDLLVSASVSWTGTSSNSLPLVKNPNLSEWEVSAVLSDGEYAVTLTATDGTTTISLAIYDFTVSSSPPSISFDLYFGVLSFLGFGLVVAGTIMKFKKKERN